MSDPPRAPQAPAQTPASSPLAAGPAGGAWPWYLLAAVIFAASAAAFVFCFNLTRGRIADRVGAFQRLVAPGRDTVYIDSPGPVTIYYENKGTFRPPGKPAARFDTPRRQVWPTRGQPAMSCTVHGPGPDGPPRPVRVVGKITIYKTGGRQGHAMWRFDAPAPGNYRLALQYKPQAVARQIPVLMSVGRLRGMEQYAWMSPLYIGAAALAFGGTTAAVIVIVALMAVHFDRPRRAPGPTADPET